jgi:hypothetical protein
MLQQPRQVLRSGRCLLGTQCFVRQQASTRWSYAILQCTEVVHDSLTHQTCVGQQLPPRQEPHPATGQLLLGQHSVCTPLQLICA